MTKPTLEQMYAWRKDMTERLSAPARLNAIYEPIEIGEQCYQLGEDAKFRWVTEEQFDAILPPGIEHDRYVAMTNTFDSDGTVEEWAENWDSPSYWARAAEDALDDGQAEGAYWTTRDEDPDVAAAARALAASQIALELDGEELIERTQENIRLLHDIVDTAHEPVKFGNGQSGRRGNETHHADATPRGTAEPVPIVLQHRHERIGPIAVRFHAICFRTVVFVFIVDGHSHLF